MNRPGVSPGGDGLGAEPPDARPHRVMSVRRSVLVVAGITSFATPFMASAVSIAIPAIGRDLHMSAVATGWIATAYLLAMATFLVPFGRLADIVGRKRIFLVGMSLFVISSLLAALADSGTTLIGWRILQGVAISMVAGTSVAILTAVYPDTERGAALGVNVAMVYAGLSVGPVVSGLLTHYLGWRSIFLLSVPLGLATIVLVAVVLRGTEWAYARGERFDLRGAMLYCVSLPALVWGFSKCVQLSGVVSLAAGIVGLVLFIVLELRTTPPVLEVSLFVRNIAFRYSNVATLLNYAAASATGFLISFYLQYIRGMNPRDAGLVLVCQPVVQTILSPVAGKLSDRIAPRTLASAGMGLCCVALGALSLLTETTPLPVVLAILGLMGSGFGLFSSPNTHAVMASVPPRSYSIASAMLATMRAVGQAGSLGVITVLLAVFVGSVPITSLAHVPLMHAMRVAFPVFALLCLLGVFASLARGGKEASQAREGEKPN